MLAFFKIVGVKLWLVCMSAVEFDIQQRTLKVARSGPTSPLLVSTTFMGFFGNFKIKLDDGNFPSLYWYNSENSFIQKLAKF